jgi:hypothetical protein
MAGQEIVINGVWGKIISGLGVAGLLAALGAGIRLEVLAADFDNHEQKPSHSGTAANLQELRDAKIRQEATNKLVEETAEDVKEIEKKIDALLKDKGIDPNAVTHDR